MEENLLTPADYLTILNRRKWTLIVPFVLIVMVSAAAAVMLPSVYKSTATILIEQREISLEYVTSSMTTYAEQRMQIIRQRVLTSRQLQALIKQFDLYKKERETKTIDEIVAKMRKHIVMDPINVKVAGSRSTATIAFVLSYEGQKPRKVQQVVNTITTLFLKEDLKVRTDQASSTHKFLKDEKNRIRERLAAREKELAIFKKRHANSLPALFPMNMQTLGNIRRNIDGAKEHLRTSREKKEELEEQLVNMPVDIESTRMGLELEDDEERRLDALKMELINLKTRYSDLHPDVKKFKKEIRELAAKMELTNREEEEKTLKNPAYVTLSSRLAGLKSDISSILKQIKDLEKEKDMYRKRLAETPEVEEKYNAILTERDTLQAKYNEMQGKMMEAKVAQGLESQQKGERFTLIESARLPEKPFKPNRLAIVLIGIVLGIGAGVGIASIIEFSDTSFRDGESLSRATGFPVLTVVPHIITRQDRSKRFIQRIVTISAAITAIIILTLLFDNYVMDLDVVWAKVLQRIS